MHGVPPELLSRDAEAVARLLRPKRHRPAPPTGGRCRQSSLGGGTRWAAALRRARGDADQAIFNRLDDSGMYRRSDEQRARRRWGGKVKGCKAIADRTMCPRLHWLWGLRIIPRRRGLMAGRLE